MSAGREGANELSQRLLGKPFDDTEPKDMARLVAMFCDTIAQGLTRTALQDDVRRDVATEVRQVGRIMRFWAEHGRWDSARSPYIPLTPPLRALIEQACTELERFSFSERRGRRQRLAREIRAAIVSPNPAGGVS